MTVEETNELIRNGLKYIGFQYDEEEIDINLLIRIREFIFKKSYKWFYEKFPKAFNFDIRKKGRDGYSYDRLRYYFNDRNELVECILYDEVEKSVEKKKRPIKPISSEMPFDNVKGKDYRSYHYVSELDHFFSYCINKVLLGKPSFESRMEEGLISIKKAIEDYVSKQERL